MSIISFQNVTLAYAEREILKSVSFDIAKGDKVGLIGSNGSGKTTLFKAVTGELDCVEGAVVRAGNTAIGCVEQHACAGSRKTVYNELLTVFDFLQVIEKQLEDIHRKVELTSGSVPEYIETQALLNDEYQRLGGLTYKARTRSCLMGLGFSEAEQQLSVEALSGGQRTKLSLGKLLLSSPDLMLLDEPTNHLDIVSVEWLEDFLAKYNGSLIVISHDRYFLDRVTTRTLEISAKRVFSGKGSYTVYMKAKELRLESDRREYEKGIAEIKRIEKIVEQQKQFNQERNYITIASKLKQIERLKEALPELPPKEKEVHLQFSEAMRSGDEVLITENLSKTYNKKTLYNNVTFKLFRGDRVFLLGPNGCGKSTLLGQIMNTVEKDSGIAYFGHSVQVGYYEQTQRGFMSEKTVLYEIYDRFPTLTVPQIRGYLGAFNFRNDDIEKRMCDLSGGERARVALLSLILRKPNFLILDEPTNHLDVSSREVLEQALEGFEGTILCVSHDRYFVNRLASKILSFDGDSVSFFNSGYDEYVANMHSVRPGENTAAEKKPNDYILRKEREKNEKKRLSLIKKLEDEIAENELAIQRLTQSLSTPEVAADYEKLLAITSDINNLKEKNENAELKWLELNEQQ